MVGVIKASQPMKRGRKARIRGEYIRIVRDLQVLAALSDSEEKVAYRGIPWATVRDALSVAAKVVERDGGDGLEIFLGRLRLAAAGHAKAAAWLWSVYGRDLRACAANAGMSAKKTHHKWCTDDQVDALKYAITAFS